jgi:hypothetical protein
MRGGLPAKFSLPVRTAEPNHLLHRWQPPSFDLLDPVLARKFADFLDAVERSLVAVEDWDGQHLAANHDCVNSSGKGVAR